MGGAEQLIGWQIGIVSGNGDHNPSNIHVSSKVLFYKKNFILPTVLQVGLWKKKVAELSRFNDVEATTLIIDNVLGVRR
jgi:hypothetical protein